jgi:hypothetical protein
MVPDALGPCDAPRRDESNDELDDDRTGCEATVLGRGAFLAGDCATGLDTGGSDMTVLSKDDVVSAVDVAAACSCCAFLRRLKSSSLISLSSSMSVLPLRRTSRTYASASSAERLLSLTFFVRSSDWSASSSSNNVSTIQLTDAPSVRCTARN